MSGTSGSCFCGAVKFTTSGEPAAMGYCHCTSCRHWSASPVNAFVLWKSDAVKVTQGAEQIGTYNKTPQSARKWCKKCGGHIFTEHPGWGLTDVYAGVARSLPGNRAETERRLAEDEGHPEGDGRIGNDADGVNPAGSLAPS